MPARSHRCRLTPTARTLALIGGFVAVGVAGGIAGCSSGSGSGTATPSQRGTSGNSAAAAAGYSTLDRSKLRERALGVLEEAAFDEWALVRANALEGLSAAPSRARNAVRAGLADENAGVRMVAAMLAGELGLNENTAVLRDLRDDPSPLVRVGAVSGLAMLGEPIDQTPLARLLEHRDPGVRAQAVFALGEIGNPTAIPLLKSSLSTVVSTSDEIAAAIYRVQVAEALVKLGDAEAVNALRAALYPEKREYAEVAVLACQAIGEVRDRGAAKQLVEIVEYRIGQGGAASEQGSGAFLYPAEMRLAAATALAKMGYTDGGYVGTTSQASPNPAVRAQTAFLYAAIGGDEALARLEGMLGDSEQIVRVSAAAGLARVLGG